MVVTCPPPPAASGSPDGAGASGSRDQVGGPPVLRWNRTVGLAGAFGAGTRCGWAGDAWPPGRRTAGRSPGPWARGCGGLGRGRRRSGGERASSAAGLTPAPRGSFRSRCSPSSLSHMALTSASAPAAVGRGEVELDGLGRPARPRPRPMPRPCRACSTALPCTSRSPGFRNTWTLARTSAGLLGSRWASPS